MQISTNKGPNLPSAMSKMLIWWLDSFLKAKGFNNRIISIKDQKCHFHTNAWYQKTGINLGTGTCRLFDIGEVILFNQGKSITLTKYDS